MAVIWEATLTIVRTTVNAWGYACEMYEDGNPGQCIAVGGGGNPGGGGCTPPSICEEQPY